MKNLLLVTMLISACAWSCKKPRVSSSLNGVYTEQSPVGKRSRLEFAGGNIMVKTETGASSRDSFSYKLTPHSIIIIPMWDNQYQPTEFEFEIIDGNTIRIADLYAHIPEAPPTFMIYKK